MKKKAVVELELISSLAFTSSLDDRRAAAAAAPISSPLIGLIQHCREANQHVFKFQNGQQQQRMPIDPLFLLARIKELLSEENTDYYSEGIALGVHVPCLQVALHLRDQIDDLDLILAILRSLRRWSRRVTGLKEACERILKGKQQHEKKKRSNWEWFIRARERSAWIPCLLEWPCLAKPTEELLEALTLYFETPEADPYKCLKLAELVASLHWRDVKVESFIPLLVDRLATDARLLKPTIALMTNCGQFHWNLVDSLSDVKAHLPALLNCYREHRLPIANVEKASTIIFASEMDPQIILNVLASLGSNIPESLLAASLKPLPTVTRMTIYGELLKGGKQEVASIARSDFSESVINLESAEERRQCYTILDHIKPPVSIVTRLMLDTEDTCRVRLFEANPIVAIGKAVPRCLCEVRWLLRNVRNVASIETWLRYPEGVMWSNLPSCAGGTLLFDVLATLPLAKWTDEGHYLLSIFGDQPLANVDAMLQKLAIRWHCWRTKRTLLIAPISEKPTWMLIPPNATLITTPCELSQCAARAILGQTPLCPCLPRRFFEEYDGFSLVERIALVAALHQLKPRLHSSPVGGDLKAIFRKLFPSSTLSSHHSARLRGMQTLDDHIETAKQADFYLAKHTSSFVDWCAAILSGHPSAAAKETLIGQSASLDDHLFAQFMEQLMFNACFYFDDERVMGAVRRLSHSNRVKLWLEYYLKLIS